MSITDPIELDMWHDLFVIAQGPEVWYDPETRELLTFESEEEAKAFVYASLGVIPQLRDED